MANNQLPPGFQEVPLPAGFEAVPSEPSVTSKSDLLSKESAEDLARGVAQGVTFGGAPVIAGGVQALMEKIKDLGDDASPDLKDLYRKYQQSSSAAFEASKQRSPYLYGAGEIGGALAPALLTGGAGLAASGARGAAELGAMGAAKAIGKEALGGAISGATMGGISGGLTSKSNIIGEDADLAGVAKDVLGGAKAGALLGGAVAGGASAIGKGVSALTPDINEYKLIRQMELARQEGKEGRGFSGESTIDKRLAEEVQNTESVSNQLLKGKESLGENLQALTQNAAKEGKTIEPDSGLLASSADFNELINSRKGLLGSQKTQEVNGLLNKLKEGSLNPAEAYELRKTVKSLYNEGDPEMNNVLSSFAGTIDKKTGIPNSGLLKAIDNQVPEFSDAVSKYNKYMTALETLKGEGYTPTPGFGYGITDPDVTSKVGQIVGEMGKPGTAGEGSRKVFNQFLNQLGEVEKLHPGTMESLGIDVNALGSQIKNQSDLTAVRKAIQMQEPRAGITGLIEGTARGATLKAANIAGKAQRMLSPPEIAKRVYNAGDEYLRNAADLMTQNQGTKFLGTNLTKALDNKDVVAKNAVLFAILQNPDARKAINSISDAVEPKTEESVKPLSRFNLDSGTGGNQ